MKDDSNLLGFIEEVSGDQHLRVEEDYGQGFVRLRSAEAERRQAKHDIRCVEDIVIEMLRNSRDAEAHNVFIASNKEGEYRFLTFLDDGCGIPEDLQDLVFEPRVTSKLDTMHFDDWGVHGRGMALYAIRSNSSSARVASSAPNLGTAMNVVVDLNELDEKTDQSTQPSLDRDEDGTLFVARGPHNIIRCATEFSLIHRHDLEVYLGSPAEIAATLYDFGNRHLKDDVLLFCDDPLTLGVTLRLAACGDAAELMRICEDMGLSISERTAHRILKGQIEPLQPILSNLMPKRGHRTPDIYKDPRSLKLTDEDKEYLSREAERVFETIGDRYYLSLKGEPKVRVGKDSIRIILEVEKDL